LATAVKGGAESRHERAQREAQDTRKNALADPLVQSILEVFEGVETAS
jgi:hypothetical protein